MQAPELMIKQCSIPEMGRETDTTSLCRTHILKADKVQTIQSVWFETSEGNTRGYSITENFNEEASVSLLQVGNQGWEEPDKAGNSTAKGVCKAFIRSSRDSNTLAAHQFPGTTVTFNTTHSCAIKGSQGFDDCVAWNQPSGSEGKPPNGSKIDFMLECARCILAPLTLCWLFCYSTNDLIPWEKAFCLHRVLYSWILDELVDIKVDSMENLNWKITRQ